MYDRKFLLESGCANCMKFVWNYDGEILFSTFNTGNCNALP